MNDVVEDLRDVLTESKVYRLGALVSYRLPNGTQDFGVVIASSDRNIYVVGGASPQVAKEPRRSAYRDQGATHRMKQDLQRYRGIRMDVQKVPKLHAMEIGRLAGKDLRLYRKLAIDLGVQ